MVAILSSKKNIFMNTSKYRVSNMVDFEDILECIFLLLDENIYYHPLIRAILSWF